MMRMIGQKPGKLLDRTSCGASLASEGRDRAEAVTDKAADADATTPDRILEAAYAFWKSKALMTAVELDVFTTLADGPQDIETLVVKLGLDGRGARDFFDALVALGFLH